MDECLLGCFSISVREVVENYYQKGDIDSRYSGMGRLAEGVRAHQRVQKKYTQNDHAEVYLKDIYIKDGISVCISGRADGILENGDDCIIEEIKSTYIPLEQITQAWESHIAQGRIYQYLYGKNSGKSCDKVQICYYHLPTNTTKRFCYIFTEDECESFYMMLMDSCIEHFLKRLSVMHMRDESIEKLSFPFAYRKYQKKLVTGIYRAIEEGKNLFMNAPTGSGKTVDSLFASIKFLPKSKQGQIFYLCAKSTQKKVALDTLQLLEKHGLFLRSVVITAKEKCCFLDSPKCNPEDCPYARNFYSKLQSATQRIFEEKNIVDADFLRIFAEENGMCPFELSLSLAKWADVVVCDYNYVFDPFAVLESLTDESREKKDVIFLVDEAHNLLDRSREMYSAEIKKRDVLDCKKSCETFFSLHKGKKQHPLKKSLMEINRILLSYKKICGEYMRIEEYALLKEKLYAFLFSADKVLRDESASSEQEWYSSLYDMYFAVNRFLRIDEMKNEAHCLYYTEDNVLHLFCTDAKAYLKEKYRQIRSSIFFSATLTPMSYYCELLGGSKTDYLLKVPSSFATQNFEVIVDSCVSSIYKEREESYAPIADRIYHYFKLYPGNSLVFFPSYAFMQRVYEIFQEKYPAENMLVQEKSMSEQEREEFLREFEGNDVKAFVVAGGAFSEAVDLKGEKLTLCIIVGVCLPKVCPRNEILKQYFSASFRDGFAYSYIYPGMNKVLQAMGRVIRTKEDKGCAVLLDRRFSYGLYREILYEVYPQSRIC